MTHIFIQIFKFVSEKPLFVVLPMKTVQYMRTTKGQVYPVLGRIREEYLQCFIPGFAIGH